MSKRFTKVDCKNCTYEQLISENDGRTGIQTDNSRHTPKSKGHAIQTNGCPRCNNDLGGVGVTSVVSPWT